MSRLGTNVRQKHCTAMTGPTLSEDPRSICSVSIVHLNHIRKKLEQEFCPLIDMSDYAGRQQTGIESARLSRALAAFRSG